MTNNRNVEQVTELLHDLKQEIKHINNLAGNQYNIKIVDAARQAEYVVKLLEFAIGKITAKPPPPPKGRKVHK